MQTYADYVEAMSLKMALDEDATKCVVLAFGCLPLMAWMGLTRVHVLGSDVASTCNFMRPCSKCTRCDM
jgi:hypothetical protein